MCLVALLWSRFGLDGSLTVLGMMEELIAKGGGSREGDDPVPQDFGQSFIAPDGLTAKLGGHELVAFRRARRDRKGLGVISRCVAPSEAGCLRFSGGSIAHGELDCTGLQRRFDRRPPRQSSPHDG